MTLVFFSFYFLVLFLSFFFSFFFACDKYIEPMAKIVWQKHKEMYALVLLRGNEVYLEETNSPVKDIDRT